MAGKAGLHKEHFVFHFVHQTSDTDHPEMLTRASEEICRSIMNSVTSTNWNFIDYSSSSQKDI